MSLTPAVTVCAWPPLDPPVSPWSSFKRESPRKSLLGGGARELAARQVPLGGRVPGRHARGGADMVEVVEVLPRGAPAAENNHTWDSDRSGVSNSAGQRTLFVWRRRAPPAPPMPTPPGRTLLAQAHAHATTPWLLRHRFLVAEALRNPVAAWSCPRKHARAGMVRTARKHMCSVLVCSKSATCSPCGPRGRTHRSR